MNFLYWAHGGTPLLRNLTHFLEHLPAGAGTLWCRLVRITAPLQIAADECRLVQISAELVQNWCGSVQTRANMYIYREIYPGI